MVWKTHGSSMDSIHRRLMVTHWTLHTFVASSSHTSAAFSLSWEGKYIVHMMWNRIADCHSSVRLRFNMNMWLIRNDSQIAVGYHYTANWILYVLMLANVMMTNQVLNIKQLTTTAHVSFWNIRNCGGSTVQDRQVKYIDRYWQVLPWDSSGDLHFDLGWLIKFHIGTSIFSMPFGGSMVQVRPVKCIGKSYPWNLMVTLILTSD